MKVIALNTRGGNQHKGNFFKGKCNKCGKYGHRASYFWGNKNKISKNKNKGNPVLMENPTTLEKVPPDGCWLNNKEKEYDF